MPCGQARALATGRALGNGILLQEFWLYRGARGAKGLDACGRSRHTAGPAFAAGIASRSFGSCPRGCSSMVEQQLPKLNTRVRFPSPAPFSSPLISPNVWTDPRNSRYLAPIRPQASPRVRSQPSVSGGMIGGHMQNGQLDTPTLGGILGVQTPERLGNPWL